VARGWQSLRLEQLAGLALGPQSDLAGVALGIHFLGLPSIMFESDCLIADFLHLVHGMRLGDCAAHPLVEHQ
jgi:hypothetical protein